MTTEQVATRQTFSITEEDFTLYWNYLNNNKPSLHLVLRAIIKPEHLQSLVDTELSKHEIAKMRSSVRMAKSRARKEVNQMKDVNITLSQSAHKALASLANDEGVTLSEVILKYMAPLTSIDKNQRVKQVKKQKAKA